MLPSFLLGVAAFIVCLDTSVVGVVAVCVGAAVLEFRASLCFACMGFGSALGRVDVGDNWVSSVQVMLADGPPSKGARVTWPSLVASDAALGSGCVVARFAAPLHSALVS